MASLVENSVTLQRLGLFNTPRARAALQFTEAFLPILDQSQTFTSALSFTLQAIHAQLVEEALETYRVANALAKGAKEAELAGRLQTLKKILGRKSGRAVAKKRRARAAAKADRE